MTLRDHFALGILPTALRTCEGLKVHVGFELAYVYADIALAVRDGKTTDSEAVVALWRKVRQP